MKTISIRLEDAIYEELGEMLKEMGQTKQTFYETFTRTALRERSIPFIISLPVKEEKNEKLKEQTVLEQTTHLELTLNKKTTSKYKKSNQSIYHFTLKKEE